MKPSKARKKARKSARILTYDRTRDLEQLAVHKGVIDEFVKRYRKAKDTPPGVQRQTLFFFPGGMACDLKRSTSRFTGAANQTFAYDRVWLNLLSPIGGALRLGMKPDANGVFHDKDDHIVVADGATRLFGVLPHQGLVNWCRDNGLDYFEFNWDWRRNQEDAARFFVDVFWPVFKDRVKAEGIEDAARNFSLVGHSFGGMVVNLILRGNDPDVAQKLARAVTVATPFYGYSSQAHRWFEGEPMLNGDQDREKGNIIRVLSSMPGLYILHFLDREVTYQRDGAALAADPKYPLSRYPNTDVWTGKDFDPWKPEPDSAHWRRYPVNMGFLRKELDRSLQRFRDMAAPMNDPRFFNIRGVKLARGKKVALNTTISSLSCDKIRTDFEPHHVSPIRNVASVPGDGTQPAWTTRLVSNSGRCFDVENDKVSHMFLMNNNDTLAALGTILYGQRAVGMRIRTPRMPKPASDLEVSGLLRWLYRYQRDSKGTKITEQALERALPAEFTKEAKERISRRIIEGILKQSVDVSK